MTRNPWSRGFVQQVQARRCVVSNRIDAEIGHQTEVFGDLSKVGKLISVGVGGKSAVRNPLQQEALVAGAQKFPIGDDSDAGAQRPVLLNLCIWLDGDRHVSRDAETCNKNAFFHPAIANSSNTYDINGFWPANRSRDRSAARPNCPGGLHCFLKRNGIGPRAID